MADAFEDVCFDDGNVFAPEEPSSNPRVFNRFPDKQSKKARFLQFAAPFSDVSSHSTSQAVILEGKYWKKRLDAVSREFKKWRRHFKEKLLRHGGVDRQDLECSNDEYGLSDSDGTESDTNLMGNLHGDRNEPSFTQNSFDALSALYALPDTLFSSVQKKKDDNQIELSYFKDSSGMIQPTLDQLNPCFDELMENFDFLFNDWENYNPQNSTPDAPDLLINSAGVYGRDHENSDERTVSHNFLPSSKNSNISSSKQRISEKDKIEINSKLDDGMLSQQLAEKSASFNKLFHIDPLSNEKSRNFQELPPQLQSPNLAAHVQAAMSSRPKLITRNKSDPSLSSLSKRSATNSMKDSTVQAKKVRMNQHTSTERETKTFEGVKKLDSQQNDKIATLKSTSKHHIPTYTSISATIPILPKHDRQFQAAPEERCVSAEETHASVVRKPGEVLPYVNISTIALTSRSKNVSVNVSASVNSMITPVIYQATEHISSHSTTLPVFSCHTPRAVLPNNVNIMGNALHASSLPQPNAEVIAPSHVNEQQLLTLAQLLQSSPTQSTEATLNYLELLQQQLNLMLKQQHEQIEMKKHIQLQAQRMLQQQQHLMNQAAVATVIPQIEVNTGAVSLTYAHAVKQSPMQFLQTPVAAVNPEHFIDSYPSLSTTTTSLALSKNVLPLKLVAVTKDSTKTEPTYISQSMKQYKKESQSLVKTLQRMGSVEGSAYYEPKLNKAFCKPSHGVATVTTSSNGRHFTPKATKSTDWQPPTTLDSAMALVSLRHGKVSSAGISLDNVLFHKEVEGEIPAEDTQSASVPRSITQVTNRDMYNEHRRQCHLSAEQKRRGLIKNAFEELLHLLPNTSGGRGNKLSNAAILQRTCEQIQSLQLERASFDMRMNQLQQEIDETNAAVSECQNKLPASGMPTMRQGSDSVQKSFFKQCKEIIYSNPKCWVFCVLMKPLFESYNKSVSTKTMEEFLNSVITWLEQSCTLPLLRPVVMDALTKLSTKTPILDDPNCISAIAENALTKEDPTDIPGFVEEEQDAHASFSQWKGPFT